MEAVEVRRLQDGTFYVGGHVDTIGEAQAALNVLLGMPPAVAYYTPPSEPEWLSARPSMFAPNDAAEHASMQNVPDESCLPPHATLDSDDNQGSLKNGEAFREPCGMTGDGS